MQVRVPIVKVLIVKLFKRHSSQSYRLEEAEKGVAMYETLKQWSIYTLIAILGLCLGAGGIWVYKSEKTVKEVIREAKTLGPKCAYGSQPIIEQRGEDLNVRCANATESIVGKVE